MGVPEHKCASARATRVAFGRAGAEGVGTMQGNQGLGDDPEHSLGLASLLGDLARKVKTYQGILRVELAQMLDVPCIRQGKAVFRGQPNRAWPGDNGHAVGTLPRGGEFVLSFTRLHAAKY